MRSRRIAAVVAALGLIGIVSASQATASQLSVTATAADAKSCGGGYTSGVINGSQKCLRRGQYCSHSADNQYRRYGFRCISRDGNGAYHLT